MKPRFLHLYSFYTLIHTTTGAQDGFTELTVSPEGGQQCLIIHYTDRLYLFDDVEGKLQSLSLQYGDEVLEEDGQMFMAVSEWNQDGHLQHKNYSKNRSASTDSTWVHFCFLH